MKVLLSAYACEPNRGSEPGIGWNMALEIAELGHKVWVLTRVKNKDSIETELTNIPEKKNLKFLYYDFPKKIVRWKKKIRSIYLYNFLWQWGAYKLAKNIHRKIQFDIVHHITLGSIHQPSFMGKLNITFIFGPVGGGERAPWRLRSGYGIRGFLCDLFRDIANSLIKIDIFMLRTFKQADRLYVTTEQTKSLIPKRFQKKTVVKLAIGIKTKNVIIQNREGKHFSILYAGRLLYWKGIHLGIASFAQLKKDVPSSRLTIVGEGPENKMLKNVAMKHGVDAKIDWLPWVEQSKLYRLFGQHDVFLFPSLHDSGGQVVLEAMVHGLPVICLDLGGPKTIVNSSCGYKVPVKNIREDKIVELIYNALLKIATDKMKKSKLSIGAINRINDFTWNSLAKTIYKDVNLFIRN